ncbi:hypothetical protein J2Z21_009358 [Streptomyces griseochromogenes]|uniref:Uncharacterized protein n=1 Tax=Streptomyces griseochromogenes TaxID=68214 RepID=A0ABS4M9I6_9ACTN|nr:hypothetical protein [Streptomyces griseochromogenes]
MLTATRPGHRRACRYARRGCRCYTTEHGAKAKVLRRRANRAAERRVCLAEAAALRPPAHNC